MKFFRFGPTGEERPAILDPAGVGRDLSAIIGDLAGEALSPARLAALGAVAFEGLPVVPEGVRIGPCVAGVGNFIAVGLNYADHAAESGAAVPPEPVLFNKAPSCISGPYDPIVIPRGSQKTDWEVELAIVIGERASYVPRAEVFDVIAGFCVCNDVSEREWQMERSGQWMKGKGCPTFGPVGPWLVTPDEIPDVQSLSMWLDVNGRPMQRGSTSTMVFDVVHLVSYISDFMELRPGDIITTGTPPGVGLGMKPPRYLAPGDEVSLGIEGLGEQRQAVISWRG